MARVAVVSVASCLFAGCQGRTADNMQPTGETVEVVPDTMTTAPAVVVPSNENVEARMQQVMNVVNSVQQPEAALPEAATQQQNETPALPAPAATSGRQTAE